MATSENSVIGLKVDKSNAVGEEQVFYALPEHLRVDYRPLPMISIPALFQHQRRNFLADIVSVFLNSNRNS